MIVHASDKIRQHYPRFHPAAYVSDLHEERLELAKVPHLLLAAPAFLGSKGGDGPGHPRVCSVTAAIGGEGLTLSVARLYKASSSRKIYNDVCCVQWSYTHSQGRHIRIHPPRGNKNAPDNAKTRTLLETI